MSCVEQLSGSQGSVETLYSKLWAGSRQPVPVSVITPAYDAADDIVSTVACMNAQAGRDFEWIVVDDGSVTSGGRSLVSAVAKANCATTVLRLARNCGQALARNTGLRHAQGRFVAFLDAGDELEPTHIATLLRLAERSESERLLPFAPTCHVFAGRGCEIRNNTFRHLPQTSDKQLATFLEAPFFSHCGALYPAELLRSIGGYDPELATDEDGDLIIRILLRGWRFFPVPELSYIYRHSPRGKRVSRDDTLAKSTARRGVCEKLIAHYEGRNEEMPDAVRRALCKRIDALAVRSSARRSEAESLLHLATSLDPNYSWSGRMPERVLRRAFGMKAAYEAMTWLRRVRGTYFH